MLQNETEQNPYETTIVYGKNAVASLVKSKTALDTLYIAENVNPATQSYYTALAKEAGAIIKRIPAQKMRNMCQSDSHQGIACYAATVEYCSLDDIFENAEKSNEPAFIVIADDIEDPHNLGAVIRTAYLSGAHGIVIPKRGGAQVTPIVHKTSAGAASILPIARVANIPTAIREIKQKNVFVYCTDMSDVPLYKQNLTGNIAIVLGNEGKGVSQLVKKLCDGVVSIPMHTTAGGIDSFNVSVAAGISMYEICRQRNLQK